MRGLNLFFIISLIFTSFAASTYAYESGEEVAYEVYVVNPGEPQGGQSADFEGEPVGGQSPDQSFGEPGGGQMAESETVTIEEAEFKGEVVYLIDPKTGAMIECYNTGENIECPTTY